MIQFAPITHPALARTVGSECGYNVVRWACSYQLSTGYPGAEAFVPMLLEPNGKEQKRKPTLHRILRNGV